MSKRKSKNDAKDAGVEPEVVDEHSEDRVPEISDESQTSEELNGPFDIDDFDDATAAELGRLDLGSVLIPIPQAGQLQVELTESGVPSAVWLVTASGRFTIAAYAAPKTTGLWRDVATELADALRKDSAKVTIQDGPWGREVVGVASGIVRFIGVDGYRWMIRCVVNGSPETIDALTAEAREALADTVVRRGDTPLPVRTPLPVQLPQAMAAQLQEAATAAQGSPPAGGGQAPEPVILPGERADAGPGEGEGPPPAREGQSIPADPVARRSAGGSAMQQLRSTTGG